ncbi:MAG: hypothetical protein WCK86_18380 [Planctomycetia bacterium]
MKKSTRIKPENRGSSWLQQSAEVGIKAGGKQILLLFFTKFANNSSVCQETSNKIERLIPIDSYLPQSGYTAGGSAFGPFMTSFVEQNVRAFIEIPRFPPGEPPSDSDVISGFSGILRFPGITAKKTSMLPEFIAYVRLDFLESHPLTLTLSLSLPPEFRLSIHGQLAKGCHFEKSQALSKFRRLEN